jgi:c-di-GMP-binding flagellar brake protein YcgR
MMIPDVEYSAGTKDVSAGGLKFVCGHPVPLGTILELKVVLSGGGHIDCLAKVCRVDGDTPSLGYHVSVYYLDISSGDRVKMNNFIAQKITTG